MTRRFSTAPENPSPTAPDLPELHPAQRALARLERALRANRCPTSLSPLYLHGPTGCGKSFLVARLLDQLGDAKTTLRITGRELGRLLGQNGGRETIESADLLIVEDLPTLPAAVSDAVSALLDQRDLRRGPVVATAAIGPALLVRHGARLRSRLAAGLVLRIPPLGPESRRAFLQAKIALQGRTLDEAVLNWLVEQIPGSFRQLLGAVTRLASLGPGALTLAQVQSAFGETITSEPTTLERIAQEVGRFFRVKPARLRGKSRQRAALVPRQVSMYLARLLTGLSLEAIGTFFGGRDHTTVLHACRKVEQNLDADPELAGAVRTLRTGLG